METDPAKRLVGIPRSPENRAKNNEGEPPVTWRWRRAGHSNSQANCESGVWREWCEIRRHDVITSEIFEQKMFKKKTPHVVSKSFLFQWFKNYMCPCVIVCVCVLSSVFFCSKKVAGNLCGCETLSVKRCTCAGQPKRCFESTQQLGSTAMWFTWNLGTSWDILGPSHHRP